VTAYGEETFPVSISQGLYTADLPSAIPEGYCSLCDNAIPTGTSVESRFGFTPSSVGFNELDYANQPLTSFSYFGPTGNDEAPILMWGSNLSTGTPTLHLIREGEPFTDPGGGSTTNGYFSATIADDFVGAVNYNDSYFAFMRNQVYKITAIDWVASSYTIAAVAGSPGSTCQPIHFIDRLWTADGNTLYWTDAIASPGAEPTAWNTSVNFTKVVGRNGPGKIYKILPLGSRIYIFTSQGLFALTVAGSPSDWYLRPLDEKAIVNSYECAFEIGGMIYYISIYGVYVTNGGDSLKISGPIENFFLQGNFESGAVAPSKRSNIYRINYMDGGLIASISNVFINSGTAYFDVTYCKNFYTRLANIAWSEWNYNTPVGDTKLAAVQAIADSVESYINKSPLSYVMVFNTDSVEGTPRHVQRQLMVYDGLRDEWTNPSGGGPSVNANVNVHIRSRYFDAGTPIDYKSAKYAYLNFYMSDKTKFDDSAYWYYGWVTEQDVFDGTADVAKIDPTNIYGVEFNSVKLSTAFYYRIASFELILNTQNAVTFKIKDLTLKQDTVRDGPFSIQ